MTDAAALQYAPTEIRFTQAQNTDAMRKIGSDYPFGAIGLVLFFVFHCLACLANNSHRNIGNGRVALCDCRLWLQVSHAGWVPQHVLSRISCFCLLTPSLSMPGQKLSAASRADSGLSILEETLKSSPSRARGRVESIFACALQNVHLL